MHTLYLNYGISLGVLGLVGYFLTNAKSALISGLASAAILIAISFFIEKVPVLKIVATVINVLLLGVFSWRTTMAIIALLNGQAEKLIPSILLATMTLVSLATLVLSLKK